MITFNTLNQTPLAAIGPLAVSRRSFLQFAFVFMPWAWTGINGLDDVAPAGSAPHNSLPVEMRAGDGEIMDFDVHGYRMHYEIFGDSAGEPLLWLSGWSGTGEDWKYVFKDVPPGFRLIGPDIRGNGASTGFRGMHTFRQSARDILDSRS